MGRNLKIGILLSCSLLTSYRFCLCVMTPTISPEKSRHLLARYEIWNDRFLYLAVAWREDSQIYTAHHTCRMASFDSNPTALNELEGTVIQHDLVYAAWREDITEVTMPLPRNTFVKTPEYLSELSKPDLINAEINILELLSKTPHPNVCKYYGCIRDGAYVMGICLQKVIFNLLNGSGCPPLTRHA